jgi:hypothetical protein
VQPFVWFSVVAFAVTGGAKIISSFGQTGILLIPDPVFGLAFKTLLVLTGIVELMIALLCVVLKNENLQLILIAQMLINFILYRFALSLSGWKGMCPCLGHLTDALHISPSIADLISKLVLVLLIIGCANAIWVKNCKPQIKNII